MYIYIIYRYTYIPLSIYLEIHGPIYIYIYICVYTAPCGAELNLVCVPGRIMPWLFFVLGWRWLIWVVPQRAAVPNRTLCP